MKLPFTEISILIFTLRHLYCVSKRRLLFFFTWIFLKSLSETAGVFSLFSIVNQLMSTTQSLPKNALLTLFNFNMDAHTLTIIYTFIFVASTVMIICASYFMNRFYGFLVHETSTDTLRQKFLDDFSNQQSVSDVKDVIVESENVVLGLFVPSVRIISDLLTILAITSMLFFIHPVITLNAILFVLITFTCLHFVFSAPTVRLGVRREMLEERRMVAAHNIIYGKADIRNPDQYSNIMGVFKVVSVDYNSVTALKKTIPIIMKKFLEIIFFLLIVSFIFFGSGGENLTNALYLFGVAFLRVMPAISNVMAEKNQLSFYSALKQKIQEKQYPKFYSGPIDKITLRGGCIVRGNKTIGKRVHISIHAGDRVLVKGASGSGKSTLARLCFGLEYDLSTSLQVNTKIVERGTILSSVAFLSNQSLVMPVSVFENIAFQATISDKTEQDIVELCTALGIHEEILSFENGYHTDIGEQGSKISLGQRQRILIARAIFSGLPILVFDEMSNALDSDNKTQILNHIFSLPKSYTIFIITHDEIPEIYFNRKIDLANQNEFIKLTNVRK